VRPLTGTRGLCRLGAARVFAPAGANRGWESARVRTDHETSSTGTRSPGTGEGHLRSRRGRGRPRARGPVAWRRERVSTTTTTTARAARGGCCRAAAEQSGLPRPSGEPERLALRARHRRHRRPGRTRAVNVLYDDTEFSALQPRRASLGSHPHRPCRRRRAGRRGSQTSPTRHRHGDDLDRALLTELLALRTAVRRYAASHRARHRRDRPGVAPPARSQLLGRQAEPGRGARLDGVGAMGSLSAADIAAWVQHSCTQQGVPAKVRDPVTIQHVAALLGAEPTPTLPPRAVRPPCPGLTRTAARADEPGPARSPAPS